MKKRLEAELISIAHRILKLKNRAELLQLHTETQKLYDALTVLKFVEDNQNIIIPAIDILEIEQKIAFSLDNTKPEIAENTEFELQKETQNHEIPTEEKIVVTSENQESEESNANDDQDLANSDRFDAEIEVENVTNIDDEALENDEKLDFEPAFELENEELVSNEKPILFSFEDLLGHDYQEPVFDKVLNTEAIFEEEAVIEIEPNQTISTDDSESNIIEDTAVNEVFSNQSISKTIIFGLNDKIGFENNLFAASAEDMNRVVSQLNTFDTYQEAIDFIEDMVKPDYQNWEGKDDYVKRFMEIVAQKFE